VMFADDSATLIPILLELGKQRLATCSWRTTYAILFNRFSGIGTAVGHLPCAVILWTLCIIIATLENWAI